MLATISNSQSILFQWPAVGRDTFPANQLLKWQCFHQEIYSFYPASFFGSTSWPFEGCFFPPQSFRFNSQLLEMI